MAKVYDALKRVQEERARVARPPLTVGAAAEPVGGLHPPPAWRRWSASLARGFGAVADRPDTAVIERMDSVLRRLDVLDQSAVTKLSQAEERLVRAVEARLEALEKDFAGQLQAVLDAQSRRMAQLTGRISIALGVVLAVCLALLLRA